MRCTHVIFPYSGINMTGYIKSKCFAHIMQLDALGLPPFNAVPLLAMSYVHFVHFTVPFMNMFMCVCVCVFADTCWRIIYTMLSMAMGRFCRLRWHIVNICLASVKLHTCSAFMRAWSSRVRIRGWGECIY